MTSGADEDLRPDALQLLFHEAECRTYDERFGIRYEPGAVPGVDPEIGRLLGDARFGRVLDVGCGTGYLGLGLAAAGRAAELHLLDLSPGMLARACSNARRVGVEAQLIQASAASLPYRDASFDAVMSRGVLHHLHDVPAALAEWRRVVRPGGPVVVVSEPSPLADRLGGASARVTLAALRLARRAGDAVGRPLSRLDDESAAVQHYWDLVAMAANLHTFTPPALARLAREAGFEQVRVRGCGLVSILWAAGYYAVTGELPKLAASPRARRVAGSLWSALRHLDHTIIEPLFADRQLLTVQGVFWDPVPHRAA